MSSTVDPDVRCTLGSLERGLLGVTRTGDPDGFEIPSIYFDFVRTGHTERLESVLEHNRLDLLSLAGTLASFQQKGISVHAAVLQPKRRTRVDPDPENPFPDFAAELTLLTLPASFVGLPGDDRPYHGNCYENNQPEDAWFFSLFDATIGVPPPWTPPPCL